MSNSQTHDLQLIRSTATERAQAALTPDQVTQNLHCPAPHVNAFMSVTQNMHELRVTKMGWVLVPDLPLTSCAALGMSLALSESASPPLK